MSSIQIFLFVFWLGIVKEPLINLVISLRDFELLVARHFLQLMALVLNKKNNAANDGSKPFPAAPGIHGVRKLTPAGPTSKNSLFVDVTRRAKLPLLLTLLTYFL